MHNSIGVRENLVRRGMPVNVVCPLCNEVVESVTHVLRDCHVVRAVWYQLGVRNLNSPFFAQDIGSWLKSNATTKPIQYHRDI